MATETGQECEWVKNHLMEFIKGELDEDARKRVEEHLRTGCEACRKEWEVACRVMAITRSASEPAMESAADEMLHEAIRRKASDIHLEPLADGMRIRFREDGLMVPYSTLSTPEQQALFHHLKLRSGMDLTETHRPQQGRFHMEREGRRYELRAGTLLMQYGERMTIRIMSQMGLSDAVLKGMTGYEKWIQQPSGLILVSGPTGSGKGTTLYALLQASANPGVNAVAVGNLSSLEIENVNLLDLMGMGGMSFIDAIRAVFSNQDPDILLLEEIRDAEVAMEAVEVALTGHLVMACMHAVNGVAAVRRMLDFGVDLDSLAEALLAVTSQRLVRRACPECGETVPGDAESLEKLGLPPETLVRRGKGCSTCEGLGFKGRIGLYSVHDFTDGRLRQFPINNTREALLAQVQGAENKTLRESAADAVREELTPPEEALRVLGK
jgi:type II secretory ATPase GspE/PulE/Tfp pilus assembly ATPase PilB-like protein